MSFDGYVADEKGCVSWLSGDDSDPEVTGSYLEFYKTKIITELPLDD